MSRYFLYLLLCAATLGISQTSQADYEGSRVHGTSPGNLRVGGSYDFEVSYRFRAEHTGYLKSFKAYWIGKTNSSGYSRGNGGNFRISLHNDDGSSQHLPSSTRLASAYYNPSYPSSSSRFVDFRNISFSSPAYVQKGKIYHLRFVNTDSRPTSNYLSLNALYMPKNGDSNRPTISEQDFSALVYFPSKRRWTDKPNFLPVLALHYARTSSGTADLFQGNGYMDANNALSNSLTKISGSRRVRQTITPPHNLTINSIGLAVGRYSGSGRLKLAIKSSSNSTLAQTTVSASSIASASCSRGYGGDCHKWVEAGLSSPVTLRGSKTYYLELSTDSSTLYRVNVLQDGSSRLYKLPKETTFSWGHLQYSTNDGRSFDQWRNSWSTNRYDFDLPFYLEVGSGSQAAATQPTQDDTSSDSTSGNYSTQSDSDAPVIEALYLTDSDTGKRLVNLSTTNTVNLQSLGTSHIEVEAIVSGSVKSLQFQLNGENFSLEESSPWELNGGNKWNFTEGLQTVTAIAYSQDRKGGSASAPFTASFNLSDSTSPTTTRVYLVDYDTGERIADLVNGYLVDVSDLGARRVTIEAVPPRQVGSVRFRLNDNYYYSTDNASQFFINGSNPWDFENGINRVTVYLYEGDNRRGDLIGQQSAFFKISP